MNLLCLGLALTLVGLAIVNLRWSSRFKRMLEREEPVAPEDTLPPVAVILAMRGADPFLIRCLEGLGQQDYPQYDVKIIIDSEEDPAADVVKKFLESNSQPNFQVHYLRDPASTCSLKVSALLQVIRQLDSKYEAVTVLDADVITKPNWLRSLITPLVISPGLTATTGLRWFVPPDRSIGNLVRRHWNIGAIIQMYLFRIPWGGSLSIRRSFLDQDDVLEHLSHCLCEDTPLGYLLEKKEGSIKFVPEAIMVNRESTTLASAARFIGRQLHFAQLYHPRWISVQMPGFLNAVLPMIGWGVFVWAMLQGAMAAWLLPGAIIFQNASVMLQAANISRYIKKIIHSRGEQIRRSVYDRKTYVAAFVAVLIHMWGVIRPPFVRTIEWRGITYQRVKGKKFEMVEYEPYQTVKTDDAAKQLSI